MTAEVLEIPEHRVRVVVHPPRRRVRRQVRLPLRGPRRRARAGRRPAGPPRPRPARGVRRPGQGAPRDGRRRRDRAPARTARSWPARRGSCSTAAPTRRHARPRPDRHDDGRRAVPDPGPRHRGAHRLHEPDAVRLGPGADRAAGLLGGRAAPRRARERARARSASSSAGATSSTTATRARRARRSRGSARARRLEAAARLDRLGRAAAGGGGQGPGASAGGSARPARPAPSSGSTPTAADDRHRGPGERVRGRSWACRSSPRAELGLPPDGSRSSTRTPTPARTTGAAPAARRRSTTAGPSSGRRQHPRAAPPDGRRDARGQPGRPGARRRAGPGQGRPGPLGDHRGARPAGPGRRRAHHRRGVAARAGLPAGRLRRAWVGSRSRTFAAPAFFAHAARVRVDRETGVVRVLKVVGRPRLRASPQPDRRRGPGRGRHRPRHSASPSPRGPCSTAAAR